MSKDERQAGAGATGNYGDSQAHHHEESLAPAFSNEFVRDSLQSLVRISLAGIGGSLVGMGLEKQQLMYYHHQQQQPQPAAYASDYDRRNRFTRSRGRTAPPAAIGMNRSAAAAASANLPATWALSCSFFVLILETSRRTSPTNLLLTNFDKNEQYQFSKYQQTALIATGDYAIGGMVAGLAASVARKTPVRWGLGMGLALGLTAGVVQAGIDVAELYLLDQQKE